MEAQTTSPGRVASGVTATLDLPAVLGPSAWYRLPSAVQRRFAHAHHDTTYEGDLSLRCSRVGRLFALLSRAFGGPLAEATCVAPARVRVYSDARGGVVWERHLDLDGHNKVVRSTKLPGGDRHVVERTDGGLSMLLAVFEEQGALIFQSRRYFYAMGGLRLPIPTAFTPGVCRVEHHDLGAGRFRFELSMVHPWWGTTFHQIGVFRDPKEFHV